MATLINTTTRVLGFLGGKRRGIVLPPNRARVTTSLEQDQTLRGDRAFLHYVKQGDVIDVGSDFGDAAAEPTAPVARLSSLASLSEHEARAAIAAESDLVVLSAWFAAETRATVRALINTRGTTLQTKG